MKFNRYVLFIFFGIFFAQETFIDSTQIKNPSLSWKLSLIPGLGQIYNGKFYKSFIINSALGLSVVEVNHNKNNINKRNTWGWWIFGIYTLGILDAYVDAHLTSFPIYKKKKKE